MGMIHDGMDAQKDVEMDERFRELCDSKAEEFRMIGYEQVKSEDIWECVSYPYLKKGKPALHEMVNDILSLKVTQFMNWNTMQMYRGSV